MFEYYKRRIARQGANMGEMLRAQSNRVIEQTWSNDPNARRVYVVKVSRGLPQITAAHNLIDVKFNVDTYKKAGVDEPAYYLQFRHEAEKNNSDIAVGSYVYMANEDGEWQWWLIIGYDERPQFRQYHIIECNYKLGWVVDDVIYYHMAVIRGGNNGDVSENSYTSTVDGTLSIWLPTTDDAVTIGYNQRFLISDKRRAIPLVWETSKIEDTQPFGITKLKLKQSTFNPSADNADMMLADYYTGSVIPSEPSIEETDAATFDIVYSGTKPTIKVGGSPKVFTAQLESDNYFDVAWTVSDGVNSYSAGYENCTKTFGNYMITTEDRTVSVQVARNYNLIGTMLTITASCADRSSGSVQVEVIG